MRFLLLALVACGGKDDDPAPDLLETGWFVDTASYDAETCPHKLTLTEPADGASSWYWRDHPTVWVATNKHEKYEISLTDDLGEAVAFTPVWADDGLSVELSFEGGLKASTDYTLRVVDCGARHEVHFRTSDYGAPLQGGAELLVGRTWQLDLVNAEWLEPGGLQGLLQQYFTTPVLFGVSLVQGDQIDFIAAPGMVDLFGVLSQDPFEPSWDFPVADFSQSPYFEATSQDVVFESEGNVVPVSDFKFLGTISADMTKIGGGDLSGLADTRLLGAAVQQPNNPNAVCELAVTLGVQCEPCPDGQPYCLRMHGVSVDGTLVPGLTLEPRD